MIPEGATEFELVCAELHLAPSQWKHSQKLRAWCEHNANRRYVPEKLLEAWGIHVTVGFGGLS